MKDEECYSENECPNCFLLEDTTNSENTEDLCKTCKDRTKIFCMTDTERLDRIFEVIESTNTKVKNLPVIIKLMWEIIKENQRYT